MWRDFVSLIYPECCLACMQSLERGEKLVCTQCRYDLPRTNAHQEEYAALSQKFWGRTSIKHTLAFLKFTKGGKVQRLLHQLKYKGQREIGEMLGNWYGADLSESTLSDQYDLIIPVPLHESKLRRRGYNQSDSFAKGLSESMKVDWAAKVMERKTATQTQTKKGRWERWKNVEEIFVVADEERIQKKNILLVDDIITTGATLEACAIELYKKGCESVSVATIAVAI